MREAFGFATPRCSGGSSGAGTTSVVDKEGMSKMEVKSRRKRVGEERVAVKLFEVARFFEAIRQGGSE